MNKDSTMKDMSTMASVTYGASTYSDDFLSKDEWKVGNDSDEAQKVINKYNKEFQKKSQGDEEMAENKKRYVRVFIVDPDDNVPIEKSLVYKSEERLTDLTDMELYYEIDMKSLLEKHNEKRIKIRDKDVSNKFGKDIFLEPVKIRDLVMTVVKIATF